MQFLVALFTRMTADNTELPDWEASAFLPYLVLQSGQKLDQVRADVHAVFKLVCNTYPPSKLFHYILTVRACVAS
jgi:hypothetical protein